MALIHVALTLFFLVVFCLSLAAGGIGILAILRLEMPSDEEHLLVSIAVGLIALEVLLFLAQLTQRIRLASSVTVCLLVGLLIWQWRSLSQRLLGTLSPTIPRSQLGKCLLICIVIAASVEFLVAMAPLTGSDAMHYHFAVQKQTLQEGFHPIFSNAHSFLCGQHHLLILFGLSLGSEQLALGFIFVGGILTAVSMACLISRWTSENITAAFVLLFLLTPVVFWQVSVSGAPDIFMGFLTCAALIVLRRESNTGLRKEALVSGLLVGGIAGAKYTGCIIAGAFLLAVLVESRSVLNGIVFTSASLISGSWPYLRNFAWTRDPVFPFLSKLSTYRVSANAMAALASDTGASMPRELSRLFPFVFFAAAQKNNPGLWDFFGPTVFALAPLILLAFKNTRAWRISLLVWSVSALGIFFSSGLPRFLLPIFPAALMCVAVGLEALVRQRWIIPIKVAVSVVTFMLLAGAAGLAIYAEKPLLAATGLQGKRSYLEQTAPDFEIAETVNQILHGQQRALVFMRHQYYLDIPYVNGNPDTSLELDPAYLKTPQAWKQFLEARNITYVVRSPEYPIAIREPLERMERDGDLMPIAQVSVRTLQGRRIEQQWTTIRVTILSVGR